MIFADEWQGLLAPFVRFLFVVVLVTGLTVGVGLGIGVAAILKAIVSRKRQCEHGSRAVRRSTSHRLGRIAALGIGGLLLGLMFAWVFRGDPLRGPMATATLTERAAFAICFFVPLGLGAGVSAGIVRSADDSPH
jgi:hypothetical protein